MTNFSHYILIIFLLNSYVFFAQEKDKGSKIDGRKSGDGIQIGTLGNEKSIFSNKKKKSLVLKDISYYLNLGEAKPKKEDLRSMNNNRGKVDDDVLVKRHFNGQEQKDGMMESHMSLGTFEGSTKYIRIEFADHGIVDGDRVRIFLNEKVVSENIMLLGTSAFIELKMKKGYNRVDFRALNQGRYGPNTAAFLVYDDKGKLVTAKAWNLAKDQNATIGYIKN